MRQSRQGCRSRCGDLACRDIVRVMGQTTATVREWHGELGWGVLDSPETPGGCWAHFSNIDGPGYRTLTVGETVDLDWEQTEQDGYAFRAILVKQRGA